MARPGSPSYHGLPPRAYSGVVSLIIPMASPTGQMGGGLISPAWSLMGRSIVRGYEEVIDHKYEIFLGTTLLTPVGWWWRGGAGVGAVLLWKARQIGLLMSLDYSSGGGGPGESPASTDAPLSLVEQGRVLTEHGKHGRTPSPSVRKEGRASRGFSRKRCPKGHHWNARVGKCMPNFIGWERGPYRKG